MNTYEQDSERHILAAAREAINGGAAVAAVAALRAGIAQHPASVALVATLGEALCHVGEFAAASPHLARVLQAAPDHAASHFYYAICQSRLGDPSTATQHYYSAIKLEPRLTEAYRQLALLMRKANAYEAAISVLDLARTNGAASGQTEVLCFLLRQEVADWSVFEDSIARVRAFVDAGAADIDPVLLHLMPTFTPAEQRRTAAAFGKRYRVPPLPPRPAPARADGKIRIGYLSGDFRDHPVARMIVGLCENHDRARFEIFAYAVGTPDDSALAQRLRDSVDQFIDIDALAGDQAAARMRADAIDILVDLGGYTEGGRPTVAPYRPANVQALYLGMGGTSGQDWYDYFISDAFVSPPDRQDDYSEKLALLPDVLMNVDQRIPAPSRAIDRERWGLPKNAFVFCCFNNLNKLTPHMFQVWVDILQQVPGSVLWLRTYRSEANARLHREAETLGLDPARVIISDRSGREDYFERLASADLFLDTFPYTAGSTAADALWCGLPILTCAGETYVSRMAGSMVRTAGLPELVVADLAAYRAKAIAIAGNQEELVRLRGNLANRAATALFDSKRFARQMEALYLRMLADARTGLSTR